MFISTLDLFKIGIGPSSSHTVGPMVAAKMFSSQVLSYLEAQPAGKPSDAGAYQLRCTLKGSLAFTGKGHATDRAVALGLHGYAPADLVSVNVDQLAEELWQQQQLQLSGYGLKFSPANDIIFDLGEALPENPNGMIFELLNASDEVLLREVIFSIGGGFIASQAEMSEVAAPLAMEDCSTCPFPFESAEDMLKMAKTSGLTIAEMKRRNELQFISDAELDKGLDAIWQAMQNCIEIGLNTEGILPGGLNVERRAAVLYRQLNDPAASVDLSEWLCAYAMAVNEENAAGHMVVTAPTNGAAGVIPAVLYYFVKHQDGSPAQIRDYLLTAAAIGGLIKHRSSISGAEVGCQGEVGSASAMAAAAACAVRGGSPQQVENAAEIALEHHLGMTCDPVKGLVQVPCIERNGFGAIKACTASSLAIRGSGAHIMSLDSCIAAMKETGLEMSHKYKETALGGLAVSFTEC